MKKQRIVLFLFVMSMAAALCSCEKDSKLKDMIETSHDAMRGSYELKVIEWLGEGAVDLDGDGKASADLFAEFSGVFAFNEREMAIGVAESHVKPAYNRKESHVTIEEFRKGRISLSIPFQCVTENIINGKAYYSMFPIFMSGGLRYSVLDDGSYSIELFSPGWTGNQPVDIRHFDKGKVTFPAPGRILLEIECNFYDHLINGCVTGPVRFSFERYSFQTI